ncbi:methyltransferase domain protein [mine drainage metagenome]|uniref:Methyltransferase domain protein n=1 Tax=mine drainage metagenome TaxID=410659 RepID=A0A1J5QY87_9ZZZZ
MTPPIRPAAMRRGFVVALALGCALPGRARAAEGLTAPLPPLPRFTQTRHANAPLAGRILGAGGAALDPAQLVDRCAAASLCMLGEQHDHPDHHALQAWLIEALAARGRLAAVALEMADADTRFDGPRDASEAAVREALRWNSRGWPWAMYAPPVMAAVRAGVAVAGVNLPDAAMKAAYADPRWDASVPPAVRERIVQEVADSHCGLLPEAQAAKMARIQFARDDSMAGHALASLGEHAKAAAAFREASKLCPEDEGLRELAAASQQTPNEGHAAASYIRSMFDGYADRFESHILSLRYRIPVAIRNLILDHPKIAAGGNVGPVLDLGCGTGLVALALGGAAVGPFTGIDLAPGMLAHAKAKGLYDTLVQEDVVTALSNEHRRWPLITAADVVCYFGALDEIFRLARKCLVDEGWFVFSVERLVDSANPRSDAWSAVRHGRYAHSDHYIFETVRTAGFKILHKEQCGIRQEAGGQVPGLLVVAQRAFHGTNGSNGE